MDTEKQDHVDPAETRKLVFHHLYGKFLKCGKKDYNFVVKNISRELNTNTYLVLRALIKLRELDYVVITQPRATRDLWRTKFENKEVNFEAIQF